MDPRLARIVDFLNRNRIRATYKAVGEAADVPPRSVGGLLGDRSPEYSWVVNQATGEPTGYTEREKHPELRNKAEIILSGTELIRRIKREGR